MIVIDTFGKIRGAKNLGNKNAYNVDVDDLSPIHDLAKRKHIAIIFVHHQRKGETEDIFDSSSGTLGITGTADTLIVLLRNRSTDLQILRITGRDMKDDIEIGLSFEDGIWQKEKADPKKERRSGLKDSILDWARGHGGLISTREFCLAMGVSRSQFYARAADLMREGRIEKVEGGYRLVK